MEEVVVYALSLLSAGAASAVGGGEEEGGGVVHQRAHILQKHCIVITKEKLPR
jgi:hypothetical protein